MSRLQNRFSLYILLLRELQLLFFIVYLKAAQEACNQMGNKKYYSLMILDSLQSVSNKRISDKSEITSIRDYMQVRPK